MKYLLSDLFQYKNSPENFGGVFSIEIGYSQDIVQQRLQTSSKIAELIFKTAIQYVAIFQGPRFTSDIELSKIFSENGRSESQTIQFEVETSLSCFDFDDEWNENISGRLFFLSITTYTKKQIILNPFLLNAQFIAKGNSVGNIYRITCVNQRMLDYMNEFKIISSISVKTKNYAGVIANECTINVFNDISIELFNFGYSTQNQIETITYQNTPSNNVIINLIDGEYYFFAVNSKAPQIYDVMKAIVKAGEITIVEISENQLIIQENETDPFEGDFVAQ